MLELYCAEVPHAVYPDSQSNANLSFEQSRVKPMRVFEANVPVIDIGFLRQSPEMVSCSAKIHSCRQYPWDQLSIAGFWLV